MGPPVGEPVGRLSMHGLLEAAQPEDLNWQRSMLIGLRQTCQQGLEQMHWCYSMAVKHPHECYCCVSAC